PPGEDAILIYGYEIDLTGNLEASGSGLDQAMFFTYETALDIAAQSPMQAEKELVLRPYSVSAILVKAAPGTTAEELAARIRQARPDAQATPRERIFASQADAARRTEGVLMLLLLAAFLIALGCAAAAAAISAASRRQHVGVLRSLGATARGTRALVAWESLVPAASGALAGAVLGLSCVLLFRTLIQERMGVPVYVFPPPALAALALLCALATALCAWLAGAVPAGRILLGDPDSLLKEA
ncbi:MAG TPA: ABC transporter permease, partial [Candidatus Limnocylindria bacterium]|nr:ABC transporter permease [Candidatus Limnocylindria bacterium]